MHERQSFETTVPAATTEAEIGEEAGLGLIWVFPTSGPIVTRSDRERLVLGRSDDADVVLRGAETSRQHAELKRAGALWVLRDLRSSNGSYVNGRRVEQAVLGPGDVVRLGEWVGVVRFIPGQMADEQVAFQQVAPGLYRGGKRPRSVRALRLWDRGRISRG
jgi:pSer/pThr/pTyr-binding forkhead associated (FHA) protein